MREYQEAHQIPHAPEQPAGSNRGSGSDRDRVWVEAFKGGAPSAGNFSNAAAISEAINLGAVALRVGRRILFDPRT